MFDDISSIVESTGMCVFVLPGQPPQDCGHRNAVPGCIILAVAKKVGNPTFYLGGGKPSEIGGFGVPRHKGMILLILNLTKTQH